MMASIVFYLVRISVVAMMLSGISFVSFFLLFACLSVLAIYYLSLPITKSLIKQAEKSGTVSPSFFMPEPDPMAYMDYIASGVDSIDWRLQDLEARLEDLEDSI